MVSRPAEQRQDPFRTLAEQPLSASTVGRKVMTDATAFGVADDKAPSSPAVCKDAVCDPRRRPPRADNVAAAPSFRGDGDQTPPAT